MLKIDLDFFSYIYNVFYVRYLLYYKDITV